MPQPDVTIYHNPKCSTSRKALDLLRQAGVEPRVVEYLKTPPDKATLTALLAQIGIGPRGILRRKGTPYDELGLADAALSDAALIDAILAHPILMERPVVATAKGAVIGRPVEKIREIL